VSSIPLGARFVERYNAVRMRDKVPNQVFLIFLEAAIFEDEQLGLGTSIDLADVARSGGLDLVTVRSCVERLVQEGLGYVPRDLPGFYIDLDRVKFAIRRMHNVNSGNPAAASYSVHISNSNVSALAIGNHGYAAGTQDVHPASKTADDSESDDSVK
jgi:hypothetical protein